MQFLSKRRHFAKDIILRSLTGDTGNKHPVLTSLAKAAGIKASNLRNAETTKHKSRLDTILSHAGLPIDDTNAPLTPPLHLSSTYMRPASGEYGSEGLVYSRVHNPTRLLFEQTMSCLETMHTDGRREGESSDSMNATAEATSSFAFSSGMAAVSSIIMATPSPLHIILPDDVYWGTPNVLLSVFKSQEQNNLKDATISHSIVDMTQIKQVEEKIIQVLQSKQPLKTILVWMETPSNPQCKVIDIQRVCQKVHQIQKDSSRCNPEVEIVTVVDSTLAPPNITQPLLLGADVSMHSATKYIGGHSDLLLGIVTASPYSAMGQKLTPALKTIQSNMGAVASPLDCWLALRGLRTLHLRVRRQCQSAMDIANFLSHHPSVHKVHYPGLVQHPQHIIASQQMQCNLFGGVLSFEVQDEVFAMAVAGAVKTITRATSLGGTETLIEHRATIEPAHRITSPRGLLRLSVGLEHVDDLIQDLDTALSIAQQVTR